MKEREKNWRDIPSDVQIFPIVSNKKSEELFIESATEAILNQTLQTRRTSTVILMNPDKDRQLKTDE